MNKLGEKYVEGFSFTDRGEGKSYKPLPSLYFVGKTIEIHLDNEPSDRMVFLNDKKLDWNNEGTYTYEALNVSANVYLLSVHMLCKEVKEAISYIIDLDTAMVTKFDSKITYVGDNPNKIVDGDYMVVRNISYGYIEGQKKPYGRHYITGDLVGKVVRFQGSPGDVLTHYYHSKTKLSYYQNEISDAKSSDKDGVGYGFSTFVKVNDNIYIIAFTKHSHGNQPIFVWNRAEKRAVANFFGISRQSHEAFFVTSGFYSKELL